MQHSCRKLFKTQKYLSIDGMDFTSVKVFPDVAYLELHLLKKYETQRQTYEQAVNLFFRGRIHSSQHHEVRRHMITFLSP